MSSTWQQEHWDTIIIGGGIAGLTASIYMARAGKKVLLLERSAHLGGRASSMTKHGCTLNHGPRALFVKDEGKQILQELGIQPHGAQPPRKGWLIDNNARYTLPLGLSSLLKNKQFSWQEKLAFMAFYTKLPLIDIAKLSHISFEQWATQHIKQPQIRTFLYALARLTTYCHKPDLISADAVLQQLQLRNVLYLDHGWQSFIDELHDKASEAKVTIMFSSIVKQISGHYPNMQITLSTGTQLHARTVLSTARPKDLLNMINDPVVASKIGHLDQAIPAKAACLDIALDGLPDANMLYAIAFDEPLYYAVHSASAMLSDNQQHHVIHVMKYLQEDHEDSAEKNLQQLQSYLSLLQPDWKKRVIVQRFLPKMVVTHGIPSAHHGGLNGRPSPIIDEIPGLYIAGDWVGCKGLLADASFSSAKTAAHAIINT